MTEHEEKMMNLISKHRPQEQTQQHAVLSMASKVQTMNQCEMPTTS